MTCECVSELRGSGQRFSGKWESHAGERAPAYKVTWLGPTRRTTMRVQECGGRRALAGVTVTEVSRSSYALYSISQTDPNRRRTQ